MTDHTSSGWTGEEVALNRQLRALADHGATIAVPRPLAAPQTTERRRAGHGRNGVRVAVVGLLAAAAMAVPVALSEFVPASLPQLPFGGTRVIASGPPATTAPLCDVVSSGVPPVGDRVVRPAQTGSLRIEPAVAEPQLGAAEVKQRLAADGTPFAPGSQLRYGNVAGEDVWTVTTCGGPRGEAVLVTADEQGRKLDERAVDLEAVAVRRYEAVPRFPRGGAVLGLDSHTEEAQVLAESTVDGLSVRTIAYRGEDDKLCVFDVGLPDGPAGGCASDDSDSETPAFGASAQWDDRTPYASLRGHAPAGTSWVRVDIPGQQVRNVLLATADADYGGHPVFSLTAPVPGSVTLTAYSSTGEELTRLAQDFDRR